MAERRTGLHQNVATWTAVVAAGMALCGVIFATGDASQRLDSHGERLKMLEADVGSLKEDRAAMRQQLIDIQQVVHRLDGTPVPNWTDYQANLHPAK